MWSWWTGTVLLSGVPVTRPFSLLLLAGTAEARDLAGLLAGDPRLSVTASLAGVTSAPTPMGVATRSGGFGGVEGLADYLSRSAVDAVVDATHPFAARISANARAACAHTRVRYLRLERPPWQAGPGDDWREVAGLARAVEVLPPGAVAFLGIGRQEVGLFAGRRDVRFVMRMIDPPAADAALPPGEIVLARPNEDARGEAELLRRHAITHVVAKNSGGAAGRAKIDAARALGLPVVMVERPPCAGGPLVTSVEAALRSIEGWLAPG